MTSNAPHAAGPLELRAAEIEAAVARTGAYVAQSPANMTRVADGLCERGLITRVASEEDRRRTLIRISAAGAALARSLLPDTTARSRAIFAGMPQPACCRRAGSTTDRDEVLRFCP
jgi:DNA-binding MarR family transcriptional regulator